MRISFSLLLLCVFFSSHILNAQNLDFPKEKNITEKPEKLKKERYFTFEYGLISIFKFKDLATSPRTYMGYLKSLNFGIYKQTDIKEFKYKMSFFSGYTDLLGYSFTNEKHKGTLTNYVRVDISRLSKIEKWSNQNHRVSFGAVIKSVALVRKNLAFGNNAAGIDVVVSIMPKIKYAYTFERSEGTSFIKRMVVPKKGGFSTSFAAFMNTLNYRSTSYTYLESKTTLTGEILDNYDYFWLKGYAANFDINYECFFGESNHKLVFGYNWNLFSTGGDEYLASSQNGLTVGLMFNLK